MKLSQEEKMFLPRMHILGDQEETALTANSLASHMSSNGRFQFGLMITGVHAVLEKSFMKRRLVPSCCVIFDLEPLSLSFDLVFSSEIFKSFPCLTLSSLPSCDLVSCYQHAHAMHHLESLLTISLDNLCIDNLDIFKEDLNIRVVEVFVFILELS
ncbi:hypothetical protein Tco_0065271 [Tanacetum coccineum]